MAINPGAKYGAQVDTSTDPTGWPFGQARNISIGGDGTGTPLEKDWLSDWWGFQQAMLAEAGLTPSGNPDKVGACQMLAALEALFAPNVTEILGYSLQGDTFEISGSLDVSGEVASGSSVQVKSDGTSIYVVDFGTGDSVYQYDLTTAWDASSGSYATKSLSFAAQDTSPQDFVFGDSGTKGYVAGATNDRIYQYTISTAWDVSTGSYASKVYNPTAEVTVVQSLSLSSDGTKMYILNATGTETVFQYTLSTPWDVSTASYASKSLNVSGVGDDFRQIRFNSSGTRMYVMEKNGDKIHQFNLSTAWDVSTGVSASISFDEMPTLNGFAFSANGFQLYVFDATALTVRQWRTSRVVATTG